MNFIFPFKRLEELSCKRFFVFGAGAYGAECQRQINANTGWAGTNLGFIDNFVTNETVKYDVIKEVGINKPDVLLDADFDCIVLGCRKGLIPEVRESLVNLGVSGDKIIEGDYTSLALCLKSFPSPITPTVNKEDDWNEYYEKHKSNPLEKFIYYGAGQYVRDNFGQLSNQYDPICFCDRAAQDGQTLFELPVFPPSAIFDKYPDTRIVVTLDTENRLDVQSWLVNEMGVPKERIANYDDETYEVVQSCFDLETFLWLQPGVSGKLCCFGTHGKNSQGTRIIFSEKDDLHTQIDKLRILREHLKSAISSGKACACTGCKSLELRRVKKSRKSVLSRVALAFGNDCNIRCCYCKWRGKTETIDIELYRESINELLRSGQTDKQTTYFFAAGEITIFPQRRELFELLKDYNCHFAINGILYDEPFAALLALGKTTINCSVDAGTKETYKKIKGVDKFEQVCENLKRYAKHAKVDLKYIFLRGINDNDADINGFVQLVRELRPNDVILCRNTHDMEPPFSDYTLEMILKMRERVQALGYKVWSLQSRLTAEEYERLQTIAEIEGYKDF